MGLGILVSSPRTPEDKPIGQGFELLQNRNLKSDRCLLQNVCDNSNIAAVVQDMVWGAYVAILRFWRKLEAGFGGKTSLTLRKERIGTLRQQMQWTAAKIQNI